MLFCLESGQLRESHMPSDQLLKEIHLSESKVNWPVGLKCKLFSLLFTLVMMELRNIWLVRIKELPQGQPIVLPSKYFD